MNVASRVAQSGALSIQRRSDRVSQGGRVTVNFFLAFAFDHHARQRLCSGVAQKQSTAVAELAFGLRSLTLNRRQLVEWFLIADSNINQYLWIAMKPFCQVRQGS